MNMPDWKMEKIGGLTKQPKFKVVKLGRARWYLSRNCQFVGWGQNIGREDALTIKRHFIKPYFHRVSKESFEKALKNRGCVVVQDGFDIPEARHLAAS